MFDFVSRMRVLASRTSKGHGIPSRMKLLVDQEKIRPVGDFYWLESSSELLLHCWLGGMKGTQPVKNMHHLPPKVILWNCWMRNQGWQLAILDSLGKCVGVCCVCI